MHEYRSWKSRLILASKGVAMGTADIIPGVSGGTIALISGIYDHFIQALSSVRLSHVLNVFALGFYLVRWVLASWNAEKRAAVWELQGRRDASERLLEIPWSFLIFLLSGIVTAMLVMVRIIPFFMNNYPYHTYSFFFGLIVFSLTIPYAQMKKQVGEFAFLAAAAVATFFVVGLAPGQGSANPFYVMFAGAVAICAMILPGLSGAYILAVFGEYKLLQEAAHRLQDGLALQVRAAFSGGSVPNSTVGADFTLLMFFGIGVVVGIFSFVRVLRFLLTHYHSLTMAALTGVMIGSLRKLWPPTYLKGGLELNWYVLSGVLVAIVGAVAIFLLEKLSETVGDPEPPMHHVEDQ